MGSLWEAERHLPRGGGRDSHGRWPADATGLPPRLLSWCPHLAPCPVAASSSGTRGPFPTVPWGQAEALGLERRSWPHLGRQTTGCVAWTEALPQAGPPPPIRARVHGPVWTARPGCRAQPPEYTLHCAKNPGLNPAATWSTGGSAVPLCYLSLAVYVRGQEVSTGGRDSLGPHWPQ